jgi:cytochrome P450
MNPDFTWKLRYDIYQELGSDSFVLVSAAKNTIYTADAEAISQITTRRNDFPKPIEIYQGVDVYGKNVVSLEGQMWRHHRKVTSPPFTEKNNLLVWTESLHQAESMITQWVGSKSGRASGKIEDGAPEAMRLSLHVISRAGFGVQLSWPHEEGTTAVPPGHTMTYKSALETLLHQLLTVIITPKWLLSISPLKVHKVAYEAYTEWGKYMREMYDSKRNEVRDGTARGGMDLMGALVKGAGITSETLNAGSDAKGGSKQILSDDEILGNAFVFILAGHETAANTIHFSLVFLAMYMSSQKRLQADLDAILGDRPSSEWSYDVDLTRLFGSMCGAVMNEQLRLIPPVLGIPKSTLADSPQGLRLSGGKTTTIAGGSMITLSACATHRNPKYWPHTTPEDLNAFRPERWLLDPTKANSNTDANAYAEEEGLDFEGPDKRPDTAASLYRPPRGAYIPFSEGYRSCLGRRFAQVEILAVIAVIFKNWTVELDVSEYLSDEAFETATEAQKREAWQKALAHAHERLENGMGTIITIQLRKGKIPFRLVKRGEERFKFCYE